MTDPNHATAAVTIADIEALAADLRRALDRAAEEVALYDADQADAIARVRDAVIGSDPDGRPVTRLDSIRQRAAEVRAARVAVLAAVDAGRGLFRRPKSRTLHGLTIGLRQSGGRWRWPDEAALVRLVRERLAPSRAAALIQVAETVQVSTLTPMDRARLGITRDEARDEPICTEDGADTAARLAALLAEAEPPAAAQEAA